MNNTDSEPEFKDKLFLSKLITSQHSTPSPSLRPQTSALRSTWTNKIKRNKINQQKLINFKEIFYNNRVPSPRANKIAFPHFQEAKLQIKESRYQSHQRSCRLSSSQQSFKRQNSVTTSHFNLSRNIYRKETNEDDSKYGILIEKNQKENRNRSQYRCGDPRFFLKNLKIKGNINLYKGNFSKFLKKNVGRRTCPKKHNFTIDAQLSPWEISDRGRACY